MTTILDTLTNLLKKCVEGDPPPPAILQNLGDRLAELTAVSIDPSGAGIDRWLSALRSITHDTRTHETLVVRALQTHVPRVAEALTLLGVVGFPEWDGDTPLAFSINWARLHDLMTRPGESGLNLLFSKVQKLEDVKALQALFLLLISSPLPLLKLEYAKQGFASLPLVGDPGFDLLELINLINSPLSLPLPFDGPLTIDQFKAAAGPAAAGAMGSLTLAGPANFDGLRDLAIELHLNNPGTVASESRSVNEPPVFQNPQPPR